MQIQVIKNSTFSISGYDETSITTNERKYNQSVFITSSKVHVLAKNHPSLECLTLKDLPELDQINILLIGGLALSPINMPSKLKADLDAQGISLELMSIGAASRTFNLLLSEGREVACLFILN